VREEGTLSEKGGQVCHGNPTFKHLGEENIRLKNTLELKLKTLKYVVETQ
jgi:hypothetical protein